MEPILLFELTEPEPAPYSESVQHLTPEPPPAPASSWKPLPAPAPAPVSVPSPATNSTCSSIHYLICSRLLIICIEVLCFELFSYRIL